MTPERKPAAAATAPDEQVEGAVPEVGTAPSSAGEDGVPEDGAADAPGTAEPSAEPTGEAELRDDLDELLAKARERDEYLSLAQRTQADFENYRKRMARDVRAAESRGIAKLAKELLPAIDNLGLALASAQPAAGNGFAEGLRLVHSEIAAALGRLGIEPYSPVGERFDPEVHEAMAQQPVEGAEPGTVVEVYQQGYRMGDLVLRPARVVVAG